jgi:hypothetical protein
MISNILRPAFGVCQLECITLEPLMHVRWNYISWLMRSEVKRDGVASPTALSPERQRGQVVMPPAKAGHMTAGENGNIGLADYDRSGLAQLATALASCVGILFRSAGAPPVAGNGS